MPINQPTITPEQRDAMAARFEELSAACEEFMRAVGPIFAAWAKAMAAVLDTAVAAAQAIDAARAPDRPAWQTPYGPPPRRRR